MKKMGIKGTYSMKHMRRIIVLCSALVAIFSLTACASIRINITKAEPVSAGGDITVVYTNDIHSYIDNVVKDDEGNVTGDGLRLSKIAAMVADMREAGENVLLVDAGDEVHGSVYGAMDEGETIIDIMNATGYQLATPGNHDLDYGMLHFQKLMEKAEYPYITCNFHPTDGSESKLSDCEIFEIAGRKVAFIGVTSPEVMTSTTPTYFQNEKGEFIYTIDGLSDPQDMFDSVQSAIDKVRDEADYVIAIGHVGVGASAKKAGITSEDVIKNTTGLDAFIDGHSHTVMEGDVITDKEGNDVILTQTGSYLESVGVMTISDDGTISTELVNDYDREDDTVAAIETGWIDKITDEMSEKIAYLDTPLYICNPENLEERWIRAMEMNSGDFTADSIYWYFNEKLGIDCDVAIQNGGGIRNNLEAGDLTYMAAKQITPFGNVICLISATGQQILDALELGVTVIGEWDEAWNAPAENGGFLQVAGLTYTVDASVPSSVVIDENEMFKSVDGQYRVKDVKIYNRETGLYEDLVLDKEYQLGGINYLLRNSGNGLCMFADNNLTVDYVGQDYVILAEYMGSFAQDDNGVSVVNTANSPLASYGGYMIDYENPLGAGRINIENLNY